MRRRLRDAFNDEAATATIRYLYEPRVAASRRGIVTFALSTFAAEFDAALAERNGALALRVVRRYVTGRLHATRVTSVAFATRRAALVVVERDERVRALRVLDRVNGQLVVLRIDAATGSIDVERVASTTAEYLVLVSLAMSLAPDALTAAQPSLDTLDALVYDALVNASCVAAAFSGAIVTGGGVDPAWRDADARARAAMPGDDEIARSLTQIYATGRAPLPTDDSLLDDD